MKKLSPQRRLERNWILYDVGNSAFTLLISAIMPIYFTDYLAANAGIISTTAGSYWGFATAIVTLCVAVLSPIFGTMSDFSGYKRPIFFFFAIAGVIGCAALGIPMPWLVFLVCLEEVLLARVREPSLTCAARVACSLPRRSGESGTAR